MNNRQRKKWMKKHRLYVNPKETWSLDVNLAKYIIPRLKKFKKLNNGYPGIGEMNTPEKWDEALDKMIQAFEYVANEFDWWVDNPKYDCLDEKKRKQAVINDGLQLFTKYYMYLWW